MVHKALRSAGGFRRPIRAGSSMSPKMSSATNAACNSNSNVTYLVFDSMPTAINSGRG